MIPGKMYKRKYIKKSFRSKSDGLEDFCNEREFIHLMF